MFWPAKLLPKVDEDLSEIELFDEPKTNKIVEHVKVKPFNRLEKRSKYWREAYLSYYCPIIMY